MGFDISYLLTSRGVGLQEKHGLTLMGFIVVSENKDATTALQSVLSLHFQEWEKLRLLLKDDTAEELREAASLMTSDERVKRLAEINSKRKTIDLKQTGRRTISCG